MEAYDSSYLFNAKKILKKFKNWIFGQKSVFDATKIT